MSFAAPAARVVTPVTVNAPDWITAPSEVRLNAPPVVTVPRFVGRSLTKVRLFAPVLLRFTAPVNKLPALLSVTAFAPAVRVVAPVTLNAPLCVIAPAVVTCR